MNILALGDSHGRLPKNIKKIIKDRRIDVITHIGDLPYYTKHPEKVKDWVLETKKTDRSYKQMIARLASLKVPVLLLKGNFFLGKKKSAWVKSVHKKYNTIIHKKDAKITLFGQDFVLFDMIFEPFALVNTYVKRFVRSNPNRERKLNKFLKSSLHPIIISHSPPYSCLDRIKGGKHVGSKILLKAIQKHRPLLVICGHIHEDAGISTIKKTKVINLGEEGCQVIRVNGKNIAFERHVS